MSPEKQLKLDVRIPIPWNHNMDYNIPNWETFESTGCQTVKYDLNGKDSYLHDHVINKNALFPAAGHLYSAWSSYGLDKSVRFTNFRILKGCPLTGKTNLEFEIKFNTTKSAKLKWTVQYEQELLADGFIEEIEEETNVKEPELPKDPKQLLQAHEFYNIPNRLGYNY
eukprot:UN30896